MKNWKQILNNLHYWSKQEDKFQKAMWEFCQVFAPDSHAPLLELGMAEAYIEGVSNGDEKLKDDLEYILYEVPSIGTGAATVTEKDGTEYDFRKESDIIKYLKKNYS